MKSSAVSIKLMLACIVCFTIISFIMEHELNSYTPIFVVFCMYSVAIPILLSIHILVERKGEVKYPQWSKLTWKDRGILLITPFLYLFADINFVGAFFSGGRKDVLMLITTTLPAMVIAADYVFKKRLP